MPSSKSLREYVVIKLTYGPRGALQKAKVLHTFSGREDARAFKKKKDQRKNNRSTYSVQRCTPGPISRA